MTDTEFSISHIHQGGLDTGTFLSIYTKPVRMNRESDEAGREIYEDRIYIKIEPPGQTKSVVNRVITDEHKKKFPEAWAKFESGKECNEGGTPIERLGNLPMSRYKELRAMGIRTIEQLGNTPDSKIGFIGPDSMNLKKEAKLFLAGQTEDSVKLHELEAENSAMKEQMAEMKEMLEQLTAAEAKPSTAKRRGRPPKHVPADDNPDSA